MRVLIVQWYFPVVATTTCGYCTYKTHMTIFGSTKHVATDESSPRSYQVQAAFACDTCRFLSVATVWTLNHQLANGDDNDWNEAKWYPLGVQDVTYEDVPFPICDVAVEAHRCHSVQAYRAAVLLARGVIEATAKDHEITVGGLKAKMDGMVEEGLIRKRLRTMADEIREAGNGVAHGDFADDVTEGDSEAILALMRLVLYEVYESEAIANRLKEKREGT